MSENWLTARQTRGEYITEKRKDDKTLDNNRNIDMNPEVRDEDMDQVTGGVILKGKPPVNPSDREPPINDGGNAAQPRR